MDEHMAALALTSLSCSPASPMLQSGFADFQRTGMLLRDVNENLKTEMRPRLRPRLISQRQDNSKVCLETKTVADPGAGIMGNITHHWQIRGRGGRGDCAQRLVRQD